VCNTADPDEVEILSLVREQIPRYRLRADSITNFNGYIHTDFAQTNTVTLDEDDADLTPEQIGETLKYF
ncbi:trafficking kinesin-binding protein 1-like isoform X4, partial [Biomphalaria glabrata]